VIISCPARPRVGTVGRADEKGNTSHDEKDHGEEIHGGESCGEACEEARHGEEAREGCGEARAREEAREEVREEVSRTNCEPLRRVP